MMRLTVYHKSNSLKFGNSCVKSGCIWTKFPALLLQVTLFFNTVVGEDGGDGGIIPTSCFFDRLARFDFFFWDLVLLLFDDFETTSSSDSILTKRRFFSGRVDFPGNDNMILLVASGIVFSCICKGPLRDWYLIFMLGLSMISFNRYCIVLFVYNSFWECLFIDENVFRLSAHNIWKNSIPYFYWGRIPKN